MDDATLDWNWLLSPRGARWLKELDAFEGTVIDPSWLRSLRRELSEGQIAIVTEQHRLRARAAQRFFQPSRWIFESKLLEQASDERSAHLMASYAPKNRMVVDMCCGLGADSVALAQRFGNAGLQCVDQSARTLSIASANLERHGVKAEMTEGMVESLPVSKDLWYHIDPDRRASGQRSTNLEYCSPSESFLQSLVDAGGGGSIKLAPATKLDEIWRQKVGQQWIGSERTVRQLRAWWGVEAFPAGSRTVSVLRDSDHWHHLTFAEPEILNDMQRIQPLPEVVEYVGDCDPAVRAAGVTCSVASQCQSTVIGDEHGYLCGSKPIPSLFVDWFKVIATSTLDLKKLKRLLREHKIGRLEIKKRGVDLDPEQLRRNLKLEGESSGSLILLRDGTRRLALLCERIAS